MLTQVRVKPLRSSDLTSTKYSLKKSILHDARQLNENHIDKNLSSKNIFCKCRPEKIFEQLEKIKSKYPMVSKNSTIDIANFIFTVNKNFFDSEDKKRNFLIHCQKFLETEFETPDAVLSVIGHDDEDGFHVHAYAVPIVKSSCKNRYGTTEKISINYRSKYSETQEDINEKRRLKKSYDTKTGRLQDRWAEWAQLLFPDLERGKKGSESKHITPKEYRQKIESDLPKLESTIQEKTYMVENLENKVTELKDQLTELEKERAKVLRGIDVREVVKYFGKDSYPSHTEYKGTKRKVSNAIDYLMYVEKLDYAQSVRFLIDHFDTESVDSTIEKSAVGYVKYQANNLEQDKLEIPSFKVKQDLLQKQLKALGYPVFRITANRTIDPPQAINIGKLASKKEIYFNANDIKNMIPQLNYFNANGFNLYMTPIESRGNQDILHILIDDVKCPDAMMKAIGKPNLLLETSPGNFQAVYNVRNTIQYSDYMSESNKQQRRKYLNTFTLLNKAFGDPQINGLRHPFRLAGFSNQKANRTPVFTKIHIADHTATNNLLSMMTTDPDFNLKPKKFRELLNQKIKDYLTPGTAQQNKAERSSASVMSPERSGERRVAYSKQTLADQDTLPKL